VIPSDKHTDGRDEYTLQARLKLLSIC